MAKQWFNSVPFVLICLVFGHRIRSSLCLQDLAPQYTHTPICILLNQFRINNTFYLFFRNRVKKYRQAKDSRIKFHFLRQKYEEIEMATNTLTLNDRNSRLGEYLRFLDEKPLGADIKYREFRSTLEKLISAKEELEDAWDSNPIPSFLLDADLVVLRCNMAATLFLQKSYLELVGESFPTLIWKKDFAYEEAEVIKDSTDIISLPLINSNVNGSFQIISKALIGSEEKKRAIYIINLESIVIPTSYLSEPFKDSMAEIEKDRILLALESGKNGVWDFDLIEKKAYFSPQYAMMLGFDPNKFPNSFAHWETMVHWEDRDLIQGLMLDYANGNIDSHDLEIRMYTKSGRVIWVWSRGKVVTRTNNGSAERVIGTHVDITERKKAELRTEAVLHMNQRKAISEESESNMILLGIRYGLRLTDSEWGLVRIRKNGVIEKEYGLYSVKIKNSLIYLPIDESSPPPEASKRLQLNFDLDDETDFELTVANKKTEFESTDHKELQLLGSELCQVLISKRTEFLLRTSEWNLQSIVECSPNGILISVGDEVIFCNRSAEIMLDKKRGGIVGEKISDIIGMVTGEDAFDLVRDMVDAGKSVSSNQIEKKVLLSNGRKKWLGIWAIEIIFNGKISYLVYLNDLSRTKEAEVHLLQNEKLATIGQLAAGVAHEINNPMAFIQSNFESLKRYHKRFANVLNAMKETIENDPSNPKLAHIQALWDKEEIDFIMDDVVDILNESTEGSERVVDIVKSIRNFAHEDKEDSLTMSNVNEIIKSSVNLIYNKIKYECEIIYNFDENIPSIPCRPQELGQVFINFLVNSGFAIDEKKNKGLFPTGMKEKPGRIEIETLLVKDYFDTGKDAIEIKFKDNGIGISEDVISRIFDPFFTTKEIGEGTGLGLSISMDIINKHKGEINVESVKCQSTSFNIHLPIQKEIKL